VSKISQLSLVGLRRDTLSSSVRGRQKAFKAASRASSAGDIPAFHVLSSLHLDVEAQFIIKIPFQAG
jgi:hypothetical protein